MRNANRRLFQSPPFGVGDATGAFRRRCRPAGRRWPSSATGADPASTASARRCGSARRSCLDGCPAATPDRPGHLRPSRRWLRGTSTRAGRAAARPNHRPESDASADVSESRWGAVRLTWTAIRSKEALRRPTFIASQVSRTSGAAAVDDRTSSAELVTTPH